MTCFGRVVFLFLFVVSAVMSHPYRGKTETKRSSFKRAVGYSKRSLYEFGLMIKCELKGTVLPSYVLSDYGCWCGLGGGGKTVDKLDECCKVHDNCYDRAGETVCTWPGQKYWDTYEFSGCSRCTASDNDACEQALCMCDSVAAKCFKKQASKFNKNHRDYQGCK